jgi:SAM-dependent methyltransferase
MSGTKAKFPESALAHKLLDGLAGIEIGGAAHNAFGLNTWNVDRLTPDDPQTAMYAESQIEMCGEVMPIDVVSTGDLLPFADKSLDFVVSSHVVEHFYDPVSAIDEWARIARRYIFIICPQRDALATDAVLPLTPLDEHRARYAEPAATKISTDWHHSRWTSQSFHAMCESVGYHVTHLEDPDDKVGNGFTIVIDLQANAILMTARRYRRKARTAITRATRQISR